MAELPAILSRPKLESFGVRLVFDGGVASELQQQEDQAPDAHRKKSDDGAVEKAKMGLSGMIWGQQRGLHILATLPADFECKRAHASS
jgi:hypothetical protein